jgi:hypothetical protein
MMTLGKRRWLAGSLGTGLVLLLVLLAYLDTLGDPDAPERLVLTDVATYQAPPPPPPPPSRPTNSRGGGSTGELLARETSRAPVLDVMQLDVRFAAVVGEMSLGGLGKGIGVGSGDGTGDGSGGGFGLVTLSELDQPPTVVSAPVFPFPDEASALGLTEFDLQYKILIDEEGRTYPIVLIQNPFSSLNSEFLEWASRVRFSPPTRLGIPVRTEYTWPVKVKWDGR